MGTGCQETAALSKQHNLSVELFPLVLSGFIYSLTRVALRWSSCSQVQLQEKEKMNPEKGLAILDQSQGKPGKEKQRENWQRPLETSLTHIHTYTHTGTPQRDIHRFFPQHFLLQYLHSQCKHLLLHFPYITAFIWLWFSCESLKRISSIYLSHPAVPTILKSKNILTSRSCFCFVLETRSIYRSFCSETGWLPLYWPVPLVVLTQGYYCPPRDIWQYLETLRIVTVSKCWWRSWILLYILQCPVQPLPQRMTQPQMTTVLMEKPWTTEIQEHAHRSFPGHHFPIPLIFLIFCLNSK